MNSDKFSRGDRIENHGRELLGVCTSDERGRGRRDRFYAGSKQVVVRVRWDDGIEYDVPVAALAREGELSMGPPPSPNTRASRSPVKPNASHAWN